MQMILIADRSEQFCRTLAERLEDSFCVETCCTGVEVLERVRTGEPNLIVLDMELPELDGISILHALHNSGHNIPAMALTTCFQSNYVLQALAGLGVEYILPKPCSVAAVVSNIHDIVCSQSEVSQYPDDEINSLLLSLGLRANLGGYHCLVEAMRIFSMDTTQLVTKTVYPEVAKICGGTTKRVERAIRSAIQDAWKRRDEAVWSMYFVSERKSQQSPPSNSHFIARMTMCLKNKKTG